MSNLPCPFCGGFNLHPVLYNRPCIVCRDCDASGPGLPRGRVYEISKEQAIEEAWALWNQRREPDPTDDPEYGKFLDECAKHCRCTHGICAGVLAGGLCDGIVEKDRDDDRDEDEDQY